MKGALSNPRRAHRPQFFGLDLDPAAMKRSYDSLAAFGVAEHALLYRGGVAEFMEEFSIQSTMVFVDADHRYEGVKRDLNALSRMLAPGVPVLCHDYRNAENDTGEYGVRRAAAEWEASGDATFCGAFGCAALFVTTQRCRGNAVPRMDDESFERRRLSLLRSHGVLPAAPEPENGADNRRPGLRDLVSTARNWALRRR